MTGVNNHGEPDRPAAATDGGTSGGAVSRPSQTDCVTPESGGESGVTPIDHDRPTTPLDRVEEFREAYPYLADLPVTEQHGRSLRREATEADHVPEYVEPAREWEDGFVTYRLRERAGATFADVLFAFLDSHQRYEQGMKVRFSGYDETGEEAEFEVDLEDSWGEAYAKREYARAMALERQLAGGEHPDGTTVDGKWDNVVTVMLTLTGSSVPDGERLAPVDQFDPVSDSWSYGAVRDDVRNICENDLGLDSHEWGYLRFAEPHGVGSAADSEVTPGKNACYSHTHVGLYLNIDLESVHGGEDRLRDLFHSKAIAKHLEVCEIAGEEAHSPDRSVSINDDVANMGSYLSAYMNTFSVEDSDDEGQRPEFVPLIERPIEYVAWGAVMWAMNRQRIGRSRVLTEAITADQCQADFRDDECVQDHDHGDRLAYRDGGYGSNVVCAECGSGWGIDPDAETITELRLEAEREAERDQRQRDDRRPLGGPGPAGTDDDDYLDDDLRAFLEESDVTAFASYGETPAKARIRSEVERFVRTRGSEVSVPEVLGQLSIDPIHVDVVKEVLDGENSGDQVVSWHDDSEQEYPSWEVEAFIDEDGVEHRPSTTGGVDMVETYLPIDWILAETRLAHVGEECHPSIRCRKCNIAMYNPEMMAGHFVHKHEIDRPEFVDHLLEFEYHRGELPKKFDQPVSEPPLAD